MDAIEGWDEFVEHVFSHPENHALFFSRDSFDTRLLGLFTNPAANLPENSYELRFPKGVTMSITDGPVFFKVFWKSTIPLDGKMPPTMPEYKGILSDLGAVPFDSSVVGSLGSIATQ